MQIIFPLLDHLGAVVLNESKRIRRDGEQGWIEPRAVVALNLGILFNQPILLQFLHKLWEFFLHPLVDIMAQHYWRFPPLFGSTSQKKNNFDGNVGT
jgi:hypothetical protein